MERNQRKIKEIREVWLDLDATVEPHVRGLDLTTNRQDSAECLGMKSLSRSTNRTGKQGILCQRQIRKGEDCHLRHSMALCITHSKLKA